MTGQPRDIARCGDAEQVITQKQSLEGCRQGFKAPEPRKRPWRGTRWDDIRQVGSVMEGLDISLQCFMIWKSHASLSQPILLDYQTCRKSLCTGILPHRQTPRVPGAEGTV